LNRSQDPVFPAEVPSPMRRRHSVYTMSSQDEEEEKTFAVPIADRIYNEANQIKRNQKLPKNVKPLMPISTSKKQSTADHKRERRRAREFPARSDLPQDSEPYVSRANHKRKHKNRGDPSQHQPKERPPPPRKDSPPQSHDRGRPSLPSRRRNRGDPSMYDRHQEPRLPRKARERPSDRQFENQMSKPTHLRGDPTMMTDQSRSDPTRHDRLPSPQREVVQIRWDTPQARGRGRSLGGTRGRSLGGTRASGVSRDVSRSSQTRVDPMQQASRNIRACRERYPPPVTKRNRSPEKFPLPDQLSPLVPDPKRPLKKRKLNGDGRNVFRIQIQPGDSPIGFTVDQRNNRSRVTKVSWSQELKKGDRIVRFEFIDGEKEKWFESQAICRALYSSNLKPHSGRIVEIEILPRWIFPENVCKQFERDDHVLIMCNCNVEDVCSTVTAINGSKITVKCEDCQQIKQFDKKQKEIYYRVPKVGDIVYQERYGQAKNPKDRETFIRVVTSSNRDVNTYIAYKINDIEYALQNGKDLPEFTDHDKIQNNGLDHCKCIEHMSEKSHLFRWLLVFWYAQTSELIVKDFQAGHAFCFRREVHDLFGTLQGNSQPKDNLGYFREFFDYHIVDRDDSGTPVPDDEQDLIILRKPLKNFERDFPKNLELFYYACFGRWEDYQTVKYVEELLKRVFNHIPKDMEREVAAVQNLEIINLGKYGRYLKRTKFSKVMNSRLTNFIAFTNKKDLSNISWFDCLVHDNKFVLSGRWQQSANSGGQIEVCLENEEKVFVDWWDKHPELENGAMDYLDRIMLSMDLPVLSIKDFNKHLSSLCMQPYEPNRNLVLKHMKLVKSPIGEYIFQRLHRYPVHSQVLVYHSDKAKWWSATILKHSENLQYVIEFDVLKDILQYFPESDIMAINPKLSIPLKSKVKFKNWRKAGVILEGVVIAYGADSYFINHRNEIVEKYFAEVESQEPTPKKPRQKKRPRRPPVDSALPKLQGAVDTFAIPAEREFSVSSDDQPRRKLSKDKEMKPTAKVSTWFHREENSAIFEHQMNVEFLDDAFPEEDNMLRDHTMDQDEDYQFYHH